MIMQITDLVHVVGAKPVNNLGIVVGFDNDGDPEIEWIIHPNYAKEQNKTFEYIELLTIINDPYEV